MKYLYARQGKDRSKPSHSRGRQQVDDNPNASKKGEASKGMKKKKE